MSTSRRGATSPSGRSKPRGSKTFNSATILPPLIDGWSKPMHDEIEEKRRQLIAGKETIPIIARINDSSQRAVYNNVARLGIPYIKIGRDMYIDPLIYAEARGRRGQGRTAMHPRWRPRPGDRRHRWQDIAAQP
jgi:hypothetical protein